MRIKISEIISILNCKIENIDLKNEMIIEQISTDTRKIKKNSLFIALRGDSFDGHDFIEKAVENGAKYVITDKEVSYPCIIVDDTKKAYLKIAEYYREKINPIVIAITGSVGKTTIKDLISIVLKNKYNVLTTYKNHNNEIGVAQTIMQLEKTHEILVIELGMDHLGEMSKLSKIVKPDYVVLTNIGISHIGNFNSKEEILNAKFEIFDYFKSDGTVIYNGDDLTLSDNIKKIDNKKISFGYKSSNNIVTTNFISKGIYGTKINVKSINDIYNIQTKAIGNHLGYSVLPAIVLGEIFNLTNKEIIDGIELYESSDKRMALVEYNKMKIINDTYNASLKSMKSALNTLEDTETKSMKIAILSDILELGSMNKEIHNELGKFISSKKIDRVIFIGDAIKHSYNELKKYNFNECYYFENKNEFEKVINSLVNKDAIVLLKGSRGTRMEEVMDLLRK
jgi:UDP-N-acetylmuramoyl-tripeptide--D-alanyl-D-alanine ligase